MTEDEMAGWHHRFDGRESEWTPGDGDGQGGLACCDSWGRKESDTTERLNWTELILKWSIMIKTFFKILSYGEKGTFLHCWWECKLVQSLWKTVWRFLKKLKLELPYDPTIPLLGIYLEKTLVLKDTFTPVLIATLLTVVKTRSNLSVHRQLNE